MKSNGTIWLNKFISESGLCSRREADKLIEKGVVFINKKKAKRGDEVKPGDNVLVNGIELEPMQKEDLIFIAFNKPAGIVSTTEKNVKDNIIDYINYGVRIFPIGRLDKDSQGLIFLTNDGDIVNKILRAGNNHEKEYIVTVNKPISDTALQGMANGVPMLGIMTKKCKIKRESPTTFRVTLIQGLNRQIRRMCEHYHYDVVKLERVRIMNINLKGIPLGEWRELNEEEINNIYQLTENSSSEKIQKYTINEEKNNVIKNTKQPSNHNHHKKIIKQKEVQSNQTKTENQKNEKTKPKKSTNYKSYRKNSKKK